MNNLQISELNRTLIVAIFNFTVAFPDINNID